MKNNERIACLTAAGKHQPALLSVQATGEIRGVLLRMRLRQQYRNTSKEELETIYSFPLAWGTTLLAMRVALNGREMTGTVIEKKDAEEKYEDAISSGDLPVMLVKEGKDLYSARLGNLKPGDEASIEIEYGQLLKLEQGRLRLTVPTTIAPRFGRDPGLDGLPAHAIGAVNPLAEYGFKLTLDIHAPLASGKIHCPSHAISQQAAGEIVRVELAQQAALDRDFILTIGGIGDMTSVIASPEPQGAEGCTLLASFVPKREERSPSGSPLRLKMLLDCSGSMAGDSMRLAKAALQDAIDNLRAGDTASLSRFGSQVVHLKDRLADVDAWSSSQMQLWLRAADANMGGTELREALEQVIRIAGTGAEHADGGSILLITDGDVWDIEPIVATARISGHAIYALGVGSSPAESLLRELAEVTGGGCEFVAPNEDMAAAVSRLMSKMRSVSPLEIDVEMDGQPIELPMLSRAVSAGEMVHIWCRLPKRPLQSPRIRVTARGSHNAQLIEAASILWDSESTVARIGAAQRLLDITDERLRKAISLQYQLLTEQTRFFLVHERAALEKAIGLPALQQVGNMLAAGWGGTGSVAACMDDLSFDMPRALPSVAFSRKSDSFDSIRTPAVWRREHASETVRCREKGGARVYKSLAQAVAHPDEADNPLRDLLQRLVSANGGADTLGQIRGCIGDSESRKMLQTVLDRICAMVGSEEGALAVLLDWANHRIGTVRISRRCLRPVSAIVSRISPDARLAARAYLDAQAAKSANPLPPAREIYDIPAFLRRQAD